MKLKVYLIILITLILNTTILYIINKDLTEITINDIKITDTKDSIVSLDVKATLKAKKWECIVKTEGKETKSKNSKNHCKIDIETGKDYTIYIEDQYKHKTTEESINDFIGYILDFQFKKNIIYLAENEQYDLEYKNVLLTSKNIDLDIKSNNEEIVTIENNKIVAKKSGKTTIKSKISDQKLTVIVTDLIHMPVAEGKSKTVLPCNQFTDDENDLLDEILKFKVEEAGYKTRAGAVAAARFLTLEFPYRVPYFYENGRVSDTGVHYADGEGRYYKKGLYLSESRFDNITHKWVGPAIWGCPLKNFESLPSRGYVPGKMMPNGLDCSGFVTWALHNGGFDPGDVGAGETPRDGQCTDLGKFQYISKKDFKEGIVRTGDLINFFGHIGMIIGIDLDNDKITIAESLPNLGGAIARTYTLNSLTTTFTHVVLMDNYYKEDGNYTVLWENSN